MAAYLTEKVARDVQNRCLNGEYSDGKLPTERQLAEALQVSRVTVRRALSRLQDQGLIIRRHGQGTFINTDMLDLEGRGQAADHASSSPKQAKGTIVVIVWSLEYADNCEVISHMGTFAESRGFRCMAWDAEGGDADLCGFAETLTPDWVSAVLWLPYPTEAFHQAARIIQGRGIPLVAIDRQSPDIESDLVMPDHFGGFYSVTKHLIQHWGRDVYYFGTVNDVSAAGLRLKGYRKAMLDAGVADLDSYILKIGKSEIQSSHDNIEAPWMGALPYAMEQLAELEPPFALACADDFVAYATYIAGEQMGWKAGRDFGVAGFGDLPLCPLVDPPLTSVGPFIEAVTQRAAELAMMRIGGLETTAMKQVIPVSLDIRESSISSQ